MKRYLRYIIPVLVILPLFISLVPVQPVSAATPSDSTLKSQGRSSAECQDAVAHFPSRAGESDDDNLNTCAKAYVQGYKDSSDNLSSYCNSDDWGAWLALCFVGYKKGHADGKAADSQGGRPSGNLTDAQIRKLAETHPRCATLDKGSGQPNALYADCITGYIAGYKNKSKSATCNARSIISKAGCQRGFDAGKADKAADVRTQAEQTAANTAAALGGDEDAEEETPDDAEVCDGIGKLAWIVCPIVQAVITGVEVMDNAINDLLTVDTNPIFGDIDNEDSSSNRYYRAWNGFRAFALGLVAIASLVVIIATAFGYEILDAYTIRKVLPRVLIAIVFISLSWNIMEFLVTLTNDVGNGVRVLIYAPFRGMEGIDFSAGIGGISWLLAGAGWVALGSIGLLSFGLTAFLAVLIAFLVLVLRELIIIFLIIVAPIGIACLILPNTRKGWQLWQNTFTAMLIVFPIISAMIATGRVFSMTTATQSGSIINELISFAAYILPYFLLPFAFRAAGGLMATLAGLANDRSRGAFDRLKGFRGNRMKSRYENAVQGKSALGQSPVGSMYRRVHLAEQGGLSMTRRGRAKYQAAQRGLYNRATAEMIKNDDGRAANHDAGNAAAIHATGRNDFVRRFMANGGTRADAEQAIAELESGYGARIGSDAMRVAAFRARAASNTAYAPGDYESMFNDAASLANDNIMTVADTVAAFKQNKGRADISGFSFNAGMEQVERSQASVRGGGPALAVGEADALRQNVLEGSDPRDILVGRHETVTALAPMMTQQLNGAIARGDGAATIDELASIAGKYDVMSNISPRKAKIMRDQVLSQTTGITDDNGNMMTVRELMESYRYDPRFLELRREYSNALAAHAAGGGGGAGGAGGGGGGGGAGGAAP